jgi:nitrate reductase NapE component
MKRSNPDKFETIQFAFIVIVVLFTIVSVFFDAIVHILQ